MKNVILIFILILIASRSGYSQNWEDMVRFTINLGSRNDSTELWLNDSIKVELKDFGMDEFTIFHDTITQSRYFIYRCACNDTAVVLIGGRDRTHDFYRLKNMIYENDKWVITEFDTEITLSLGWNLLEEKSQRKSNKRCFMTIN